MVNLKDLLRTRIVVDMIRSVQSTSRWKIVVVDAGSLKIINTSCKMTDILEENVTLIEDISRKRTSYSQKDAIYFLSATAESVASLIGDFSGTKPMYATAHVFFTSALADALFEKIKRATGLTPFIKTLRELNIDFIATEAQIFTVDAPRSFFTLFNPATPAAQNADITLMARRLLSLFSSLGEMPFIRYHDPAGEKRSLSAKLANILQTELEEMKKLDPEFPPKSSFKRPILIIVDRSYDLMAPLLHEFTYQAMMNDLLTLEGGRYVYQSEGEKSNQSANLDESDTIWMLIRHWHFAEAVEYIRETFNRFLSENKAAVTAMGGETSAKGLENLAQLKDTLTSLPQFQEMKSKYSAHINICQECRSIFERRKLDSMAAVEQDLAMGETADGKAPRNVMIDMVPLLDDNAIPAMDKLRLLLLYIVAQEGIQDSDRRRLLEVSKLSLEDAQAITNMSIMGVRLTAAVKGHVKNNTNKYSYYGRVAEKKKKKKKKTDDLPYDLSRFTPLTKYLVEDQINHTLDPEVFPWVVTPTPDEIGAGPASTKSIFTKGPTTNPFTPLPNAANQYSLRTTRPSWSRPNSAIKSGMNVGASSPLGGTMKEDEEDLRKNGARIVVFVMGGMTFSEVRATYELIKEQKRDVLFGSTNIINPLQFMGLLKQLHKTEGHSLVGSSALTSSLSNLVGPSSPTGSPIGSVNALTSSPTADKDGGDKGGGKKADKKPNSS